MGRISELVQRIQSAARVLRDGNEIAAVTARPSDMSAGTRYRMIEQIQLVFRYSKWVKVAASRNASAVASVPLRVYRVKPQKGGMLRGVQRNRAHIKRINEWSGRFACKHMGSQDGWEEITDDRHPLVKVLGQANPQVNGFELLEFMQLGMELCGNGYWTEVYGSERYPVELWNLYPQFTEIRPAQDGSVACYQYGRPEAKITIRADATTQFKFPNPFDPWYGLAPLASCVNEADLSGKLSEFSISLLDNGATPGMVIHVPGANKDQREEIRRELQAKQAGSKNVGKSLIFGGAKDLKWEFPKMAGIEGANPVLLEAEVHARNVIAACFDMPVGLLNMEERSLANGKVVAPHWQLLSIKPRCQRIEDKINEQITPKFREALNDPTLIVAFDNAVDEDRSALVMEVSTLTGGKPIITQDEARAKLGMPVLTPEQKEEMKPPEPDGGFGNDSGEGSASKSMWNGHEQVHEVKALPKGVAAISRSWAEALSKLFRQYAPAYARNATGDGLGVDVGLSRQLAMGVFEASEIPMNVLGLMGYNAGVDELNNQADVDLRRAEALSHNSVESLNGYRLRLANAVTQTYDLRIRNIVQSGIREGETLAEVSQRVRTLIPHEAPYAADRIARTETSRALNAGKDLSYQESKVVTGKRWLLSGNPCKVCRAIHSQFGTAKVGEPFVKKGTSVGGVVLDYGDIEGGDAHPNCSCGVSAIISVPEPAHA